MPDPTKRFDSEHSFAAYATAERMDLEGWKSGFTDDGIFTDQSVGVTYRGAELDYPVRQYGTAFADMHRAYDVWTVGDDTVIVRLALQGTHWPSRPSVRDDTSDRLRMDAPCADIFGLSDGEIRKFDCYPEGSVILTQLGVIRT